MLTEMDGIISRKGVTLIGATNRPGEHIHLIWKIEQPLEDMKNDFRWYIFTSFSRKIAIHLRKIVICFESYQSH